MKTSAFAAACDCCGVASAALLPRLNSEPKAPARLRLSSVRYPIVTPGDMSSADFDLPKSDAEYKRKLMITEHSAKVPMPTWKGQDRRLRQVLPMLTIGRSA